MSISKLFLFSKNADATATEQGFLYQKLTTLKTWLQNRINNIDERIYCDLEDDIFQRDLIKHQAKFRQIKLYSTNFSFSKEEIQKTLTHFFMLFCKGDYLHDEVTFAFETNSGIARETRGNDGDLLREWATDQGNITDEQMERILERVKPIIDEYISEAYQKLMDAESKAQLQEAKNIYDQLPDEVWRKFIKSIKWQFDQVNQSEAIPKLYEEIEVLVPDLPVTTGAPGTSVALLLYDITKKTTEKDPEQKYVTNQSLDLLLLNGGNEKDQWYANALQDWSGVTELGAFNFGEFHEVINAARYCRWEMHRSGHAQQWCRLLKLYIKKEDTLTVSRRKAIYEYIFLLLSPDPKTGRPGGTMAGQQRIIKYYFGEFQHRNHARDIEEDITMLQLVQTHRMRDTNFLSSEEIEEWQKLIAQSIEELLQNARNADEKCLALELKGHMLSAFDPEVKPSEKINDAIAVYREIIPLLETAKTYSISRLFDLLGQLLSMFILHDADEEAIEGLEAFIMEIQDAASRTGRQHDAAHALVERGAIYLQKKNAKSFLKALELFHQAKALWNLDETREGFVLALLNISQIYAGLGLHLAAKYYGLCAVWASTSYGDAAIFKRISDGFTMVFHADFHQGSWISALEDYFQYITFRLEFRPETLDLEKDEQFRITSIEIAGLIGLIPVLHPEMSEYIEVYKQRLGWVYETHLRGMVEAFTAKFQNTDSGALFVKANVSGTPLNDVGPKRNLRFKVLGMDFCLHFKNDAITNAVAEEFGALLQITLAELGLLQADLHFLNVAVRVNITAGGDYKMSIDQEPDHENTIFKLSIPPFSGTEQADIQKHYGFLATNIQLLLENLTLLKTDEFEALYADIYAKQKLGEKGLAVNTYQKVYFNLQSIEDFNESRREALPAFSSEDYSTNVPDVLPPVDGLSSKYSAEFSNKKISERYDNLKMHLHLTLKKWENDDRSKSKITEWRKAGWLDWQILMTLSNFILNNKARIMSGTQGAVGQDSQKKFEAEFLRLNAIDESACFMDIPIEVIDYPELDFWLEKMPVDTLPTFGLQNGMRCPNFKAIRAFLSQRFAFDKDDLPKDSPLSGLS
ncbi:hypothetical protein [Mucilaginibacter lacusdianchii]|uniref:hypothetical protein n=1 Tax=Mucilaginibacter lacusdianchii TaxID=2684211 RepID=UPI00131B52DB|nr:hypothetical protein [Mucilaginibacter sp. JXJ CY 39]